MTAACTAPISRRPLGPIAANVPRHMAAVISRSIRERSYGACDLERFASPTDGRHVHLASELQLHLVAELSAWSKIMIGAPARWATSSRVSPMGRESKMNSSLCSHSASRSSSRTASARA